MDRLILIKYGELTTKKANRHFFIKMLEKNILNVLKNYQVKIIKDRVRMYIEVDNKDVDEVVTSLTKVFGIHGIVICYRVNTNIEEIEKSVLEIVKKEQFHTFKVETKRADKTFPIHTMDFNNQIGSLILKNIDCKVDVHHPDMLLRIEIRSEGTFIYTNEIRGAGGYPVGIQGKGMLMLSGGIDSPVAGYLALKRGVDLECMYFESPPHTSENAKNKVKELANLLNRYSGNIVMHVVPFTKIQEAIYQNVPSSYMITIMRRMMYRICAKYAQKRNCQILINGESIGQVASQTINSMVVINEVTNMPVIRPVACLDKLEIIDLSKKIETYETSILPYEDCCTIFLPKHPVINPILDKCLEYEKRIDYQPLIDQCIEHIETIKDLNSNDYQDLL
ncbi:MAG: tRNA 4-thiouridine(8) synthase ThiI [Bacilli bacterium]|nr:tRNA 4-thiouridine(8) synthase ThiI [Bacilli bacterium]MDD4809281.1 tRNA 4-thiouridine(8) synthase ThiI [Bacilli bacterium]